MPGKSTASPFSAFTRSEVKKAMMPVTCEGRTVRRTSYRPGACGWAEVASSVFASRAG